MKRILVTGGPVHAYLDPVKIITNRFKGGMMAEIADRLLMKGGDVEVFYLTAKGAKQPDCGAVERPDSPRNDYVKIIHHDGLPDYRAKVRTLALDMDAVMLGAAVANLIPEKPFEQKFPSHNYEVGDTIPINFTIAPRIIDEVKSVMKPGAHLFGFKLLAGQSHDELIRAAYEVLLASKATCVFANDASTRDSLMTKYAVMKDKSVHEMELVNVAEFILRLMDDEYYETFRVNEIGHLSVFQAEDEARNACKALVEEHGEEFVEVERGYRFGTVAVRMSNGCGKDNSFVTTGRGKQELDSFAKVISVNHDSLQITATNKATLNAPLLHWIFSQYPEVHSILHFHRQEEGLPVYPYAPPGTKRDSVRGLPCKSFNIEGHGCFLLRNEKGEVIR